LLTKCESGCITHYKFYYIELDRQPSYAAYVLPKFGVTNVTLTFDL